jgi:hypothetical protein
MHSAGITSSREMFEIFGNMQSEGEGGVNLKALQNYEYVVIIYYDDDE